MRPLAPPADIRPEVIHAVSEAQEPELLEPAQSESRTPADSDNDPYALSEFESLALQNNPTLAEAAARVDAAQGRWVQAGLPPNPVIGYSGQQVFSGGLAEQHGLFVGRQYIRGGKLALNRDVAAHEIQRAEYEFVAQQQRVLTDVRIAFYEALVAQQRVGVAQELVRLADEAARAVQTLFDNGEVGRTDPLRVRVEADQARITLQTVQQRQLSVWRRLAALIGTPDMELRSVQGDLEAAIEDLEWEDTLRQIVAVSPEIAAAAKERDRARASIDRAYAEVVPDVEVQAVVQSDNGTGSANGMIQVTLPLPILNRNEGGIQQAEADLLAAQSATSRVALDLQSRPAKFTDDTSAPAIRSSVIPRRKAYSTTPSKLATRSPPATPPNSAYWNYFPHSAPTRR